MLIFLTGSWVPCFGLWLCVSLWRRFAVRWEWLWEAHAGRWLKAVQLYYGSCREAHKQTTSGRIKQSSTFITPAGWTKAVCCACILSSSRSFFCCWVSWRSTYALICSADGLKAQTFCTDSCCHCLYYSVWSNESVSDSPQTTDLQCTTTFCQKLWIFVPYSVQEVLTSTGGA